MIMRTHLCSLLLLLTAFAPAWTAEPAASWQPVLIELRDGAQQRGSQLKGLFDGALAPQFDGQPLDRTTLRRMRNLSASMRPSGPAIELANGDFLPCEVLQYLAADDQPAALRVLPTFSQGLTDSVLLVRLDWIRRIVDQPRPPSEGSSHLLLKDGRKLAYRSFHWMATGVRVLTEGAGGEVIEVPFSQIAELELGDLRIETVLHDSRRALAVGDPAVARLTTTDGARLTFPSQQMERVAIEPPGRRVEIYFRSAIQPSWSLNPLYLDPEVVAACSFHAPTEIPLSVLPASDVRQRLGLRAWDWQRDRNVTGGLLASGRASSELGLGMHSHTEVDFLLPPGARSLQCRVGIDRIAEAAGCAECEVLSGSEPRSLWKSGFLQGGQQPAETGPLPVEGETLVTLRTGFGHDNRPEGAAPLDLGDHVDWIDPIVVVQLEMTPAERLALAAPELAGWLLAPEDADRVQARQTWDAKSERWLTRLQIDHGDDSLPVRFTRRLQVGLANAFFRVQARRLDSPNWHMIRLDVDGQRQTTTMNGDLETDAVAMVHRKMTAVMDERVWLLSEYAGKEVEATLIFEPKKPGPATVIIAEAAFVPLVAHLPPSEKPITPDVPLTSLKPQAMKISEDLPRHFLHYLGLDRPIALKAGQMTDGSPLKIRGFAFDTGIGLPNGLELTYELDPKWRRFVAIGGLAYGWNEIGYEILLDGEPHWRSTDPTHFGRNTPCTQLIAPIPPGHKTMTVRLYGGKSSGGLAHAGFMRE
ncbi:NPCBM/NEW2 domain-containing protein [Lignipirellula cremea]|uniref:NPCBM/NEW2 domain protein n=1 Tax=Lignipirellula cremea TaxID=2528010 RepID=A0A518E2F2_9BACT|nr:NPCBM/NEW2 domain-containing protein [Lignipirellula cremea]QDU98270.1 NPCBM/NEW2 domain protein [Lignipirellula cremea]